MTTSTIYLFSDIKVLESEGVSFGCIIDNVAVVVEFGNEQVSTYIRSMQGIDGVQERLRPLLADLPTLNFWLTNSEKVLSVATSERVVSNFRRLETFSGLKNPHKGASNVEDLYGHLPPPAIHGFIKRFASSGAKCGVIYMAGYTVVDAISSHDPEVNFRSSVAIGKIASQLIVHEEDCDPALKEPTVKWFRVLEGNLTAPSSATRVFNLFRDYILYN
ncbi:ORF6 [Air potato virus 1]|uniref:ORF6 n=1 Tax=Air potato virus 1 TaxID=2491018 RepID=A0A3G6V9D0_9CLOS|nr:ORF6 [Air potato virus 1]AZB50212.1 ORF6 [Air potato virus 1]